MSQQVAPVQEPQPHYRIDREPAPRPRREPRRIRLSLGLVLSFVPFVAGLFVGSAITSTPRTVAGTGAVTASQASGWSSTRPQHSAPAAAADASAPAGAVSGRVIPGDGTFRVGIDVKPGTYRSGVPASGNCHWARLRDGDGLDAVLATHNSAGQSVVTIRRSDKRFETAGCSDWRRVE